MHNPRHAQLTAARIRVQRRIGLLKRPRRRARLPRQVPPVAIEREYSKALRGVMDRVRDTFDHLKNELPRLLASAQSDHRMDAGEGRRVRNLIDEARRKIAGIVTPEIEPLARKFAQRTSTYQRTQLNKQTKAALGADVFIADRRLFSLTEAFVDSNVGLIKKLSDDVAGRVETLVLRSVQDAKPWDEVSKELQAQFDFSESRANLIARDQIGKFYGQTNAARQRELGVSHFIWRTSGDERVRDEHEALDGQEFSYDDPPSEGLPGEPIQCRCSAEPVFDGILDQIDEA